MNLHAVILSEDRSRCNSGFHFVLGNIPVFTGNTGIVPPSTVTSEVNGGATRGVISSTIRTGFGVLEV